jgi:hypothetical protein
MVAAMLLLMAAADGQRALRDDILVALHDLRADGAAVLYWRGNAPGEVCSPPHLVQRDAGGVQQRRLWMHRCSCKLC